MRPWLRTGRLPIGERAGFGRVAYGVSKTGLIHLTRHLALDLGPFGVTANAVGPGPVDTDLARRAQTSDMRADYLRTIPAGRYGTPEEIASAVAFLCGPEASYVNGQTLFVDGGFGISFHCNIKLCVKVQQMSPFAGQSSIAYPPVEVYDGASLLYIL